MAELLALAPLAAELLPLALPLLQGILTPKKKVAGSGRTRHVVRRGGLSTLVGGRAHRVAPHMRMTVHGPVHVKGHVARNAGSGRVVRRTGRGYAHMGNWPLLSRPLVRRMGMGAVRHRAPVRGGHGFLSDLASGLPFVGKAVSNLISDNLGLGMARRHVAARHVRTGRGYAHMGDWPLLSRPLVRRMGMGAVRHRAPAQRMAVRHKGRGFLSDLASGLPFVGKAVSNLISDNLGLGVARRRARTARGGRRRNRRTPAPMGRGRHPHSAVKRAHNVRPHMRVTGSGRVVRVKGHRRGGLLYPA